MFFDPFHGWYFWLLIPGVLLGLYAQIKLSTTYNRYIAEPIASGLSGAEAAREILDRAGLSNVPVAEIGGHLTDHYDPTKKALFLSSQNYHERTLAAVGVAAHEAGHALQHKAAYTPMQLRMAVVPITQFASYAWIGITLLGMFLNMFKFIGIGIAILTVVAIFQIITLPVELDASRRAKVQLLDLGIVKPQEGPAISRVLNAAALTYVAALVTAVMQVLRLVMIASAMRDRD